MKVSEITYESDISEFLSIDDIQSCIGMINILSSSVETIVETIDNEITNGGLDVYSFNIDGESPAHDIAVELVNSLHKVVEDLNEASKNTEKNAKRHRYNELKKLQTSLKRKINEINSYISYYKAQIDNCESYMIACEQSRDFTKYGEYSQQSEDFRKKVVSLRKELGGKHDGLNARLEEVNALLEEEDLNI